MPQGAAAKIASKITSWSFPGTLRRPPGDPPRRPKTAPRAPQDGPKSRPEASKSAPNGPPRGTFLEPPGDDFGPPGTRFSTLRRRFATGARGTILRPAAVVSLTCWVGGCPRWRLQFVPPDLDHGNGWLCASHVGNRCMFFLCGVEARCFPTSNRRSRQYESSSSNQSK